MNNFIGDIKSEFVSYNKNKFAKDIIAGVTVTAVALPLCLALGVNSGVGALSGLISAIIAGLVVSFLSGGSYQIGGPTAAMTIILFTLYGTYGSTGVFLTGLIAGVVLIISGLLKLGKFIAFIPLSVITGFTAGLSLNIIIGQINSFFGVTNAGINIIDKMKIFISDGFNPNISALIIGVLVLLLLFFYPAKLKRFLPPSLAAIIIVTILNIIFSFPVNVVGEIPKTLLPDDRLRLNINMFNNIGDFMMSGFSIAVLCMIESLLCGKSGSSATKKKFNADKELIAQGIGNMVIPFFGGIPTTSVLARTSVGIKAEGQTRITAIVQALMLIACMFIISPFMAKIPMCAMASVLIYTAINMNDIKSIKYIFKNKLKSAIFKFIATLIITVIFDLTLAIVIGCSLSILLFVNKIAKLDITIKDINIETITDKKDDDKRKEELKLLFAKTKVCYIGGPIFFAAADNLIEVVDMKNIDTIIFSIRGVPMLDASGAQMLYDMCSDYKKNGIEIYFCGVCENVLKTMKKTAITKVVDDTHFCFSADIAIKSIIDNNSNQ